MLFTDLVGSTELLEALGDDEAELLRRRHFKILREALQTSGGQEVKNLGDGLMVTFDSAVDAVGCAVAMQQAVDRHNRQQDGHPIEVRVGLNVGEPIRDEDDYFGTSVVVAKRLCDRATGGQILASDLVRGLVGSRGGFEFKDVGPLALKGLSEPMRSWDITWFAAADESIPGRVPDLPQVLAVNMREASFVARYADLEQLQTAWKETATSGKRSIMLIAGDPGIGKTRLAAELARRVHADGHVVLFGRCDEEALVPYQPWVEALQPLGFEELQGFSGAERTAGDSEVERFHLFESVVSSVATASTAHPILLVLDDLHWADKPSLLLLRHLARSGHATRLLIVGTYRESDLVRTHPLSEVLGDLRRDRLFERVSLHGLDEAGVTELIAAWAQHDPPAAFVRAVFNETEGNPFFVEEVLFHLAESGAIRQENGVWVATVDPDQMGIPEGVREVIGRRLSRLSDDANQALTVAAVIGREFDLDVLATIVERSADDLFETMEDAVRARIVTEAQHGLDRYRFAHALIRETLYDELSSGRKLRLHRKVAAALEAKLGDDVESHLATLAYHLVEAAPGGDVDRAVDYARRAGARALETLAFEEAALNYRRALQAFEFRDTPDAVLHTDLLIELAEATRLSGDMPGGRALNEEALTEARRSGDRECLARAAIAIAGYQWEQNDALKFTALSDALAGLREGDSELRARVLARFALSGELHPSQRCELADMAIGMARRLDDQRLLLEVFQTVVPSIWSPATVDRRRDVVTEMRALMEATGAVQVALDIEVWDIVGHLEVGDIAGLDKAMANYLQLAEASRHPIFLYWAEIIRAMRLITRGEIEEGERTALAAYQFGERIGTPVALNFFGAQLYPIRREQGRLAEMEPLVQDLVDRYPGIPSWRCALANLYAEIGDRDQAAEHYNVIAAANFELPFDQAWIIGVALLADTAGFLGDVDGAAILHGMLSPYADHIVDVAGLLDAYGSVRRSLGVLTTVLGRFDEAEDHFERALVKNRELGDRWFVHTEIDFARMLLTRAAPGDAERAKELLDDATAVATARGLIAAVGQASEVARSLT